LKGNNITSSEDLWLHANRSEKTWIAKDYQKVRDAEHGNGQIKRNIRERKEGKRNEQGDSAAQAGACRVTRSSGMLNCTLGTEKRKRSQSNRRGRGRGWRQDMGKNKGSNGQRYNPASRSNELNVFVTQSIRLRGSRRGRKKKMGRKTAGEYRN